MSDKIRKATHTGDLAIGGMVIPCAVLEDGTRVLTETGITNALLGTRSGGSRRIRRRNASLGTPTPLFLAPGQLKPFIPKDLLSGPLKPLRYHLGRRALVGFEADVLPAVCDVWLKAREAGALQAQQFDKAKKAEILMRGLAHIGITALVDEATGYQEIRDRQALQQILDKFLQAERAKWAKRFPDDFYRQMFRLRNWQWRGMKVNRPSIVGTYTNDFVYDRLAPGVLDELKRLNPKNEKGHRSAKHHQYFTPDIGHPALQQHLGGVVALMRASTNWDQFKRMLQRAYPKVNTNLDLPLDDPPET